MIIEYLVDTYNKENTLTYTTLDKFVVKQWLYFQMSRQGPYFRQVRLFVYFYLELIASVIDRYRGLIKEVLLVLNRALQDR